MEEEFYKQPSRLQKNNLCNFRYCLIYKINFLKYFFINS